MFFPEANGVFDPSFGAGTNTEAEAMTNARIFVILHVGPGLSQSRDASFHHGRRRNSIALTDDDERWGFVGSKIGMAGYAITTAEGLARSEPPNRAVP